jgi:hypothetical protein
MEKNDQPHGRAACRRARQAPPQRALGSLIGMIAIIWPPLKKKRVESSIEQTTTASGALNPDCREAFPYALDVSFETLKNPRFQARGFFSSRGLWHKPERFTLRLAAWSPLPTIDG